MVHTVVCVREYTRPPTSQFPKARFMNPVYGRTDARGITTSTFTTESQQVLNTLLVVGPNGIQRSQDFTAGY